MNYVIYCLLDEIIIVLILSKLKLNVTVIHKIVYYSLAFVWTLNRTL